MKITQLLLVLALTSASCSMYAPRYAVAVSGIADQEMKPKKKYVLLSGEEGIQETSLQFKEYASFVNRALSAKGYILVDEHNEAETAIFLTYGIGDPTTSTYTYSVPVWGQTGVSSSSTYGTVSSYGGYGTYSGTTTYTPTYGITGYSSRVGQQTTYFRHAELTAVDLASFTGPESTPIWKTTIGSSGTSGDLRHVFPVMLGAAAEYIGENTGEIISIHLLAGDSRVRQIKGEFEIDEGDS